jgi:hypothetical protein
LIAEAAERHDSAEFLGIFAVIGEQVLGARLENREGHRKSFLLVAAFQQVHNFVLLAVV